MIFKQYFVSQLAWSVTYHLCVWCVGVFQVREHPMYLLIKARILKKQGDLQEAINALKAAMALPGVRAGGGELIFFSVFSSN